MAKYSVTIDRSICIACGIAPNLCPQVFILGDDNGKNRVKKEYEEKTTNDVSTGVISDELYQCVKQSADACPVQAISIKSN